MPENKKPWEVNYTEEDKKPWEQDYDGDTLKKKEETTERDYSALSEQLGKRFENAGSTLQTTKSEEDLKAKKKRIQPELYRLAEESPEKFSSDEGRKGVLTALRKQGYTSSEADTESKRVQEIAINKPIKDNSNRAKSYLKYVSGYGKDASITKVANASDSEIEEWTSQMLDKGISQQGIDNAIYDFGNKYRDIKGKEKAKEYDSAIQATAWDRVRQTSESGVPTDKEVEAEKRAMVESNLKNYLPEDLKIQAGIEEKFSTLINELKDKKTAGTLTNAERDSYEAKLVGLEKLRNSSDLPDRLFNPVTGDMVDRKDANSEALDYEDRVVREGEKLTDKEKTFGNAKKALHRFEAMDDLYNTEVTFTMRDGRVITAPYSEIDSRYADMFDDDSESGRRIAEAKGIKNNWLKAKAQFEAVNRAYMTNTDPSQVEKEYWSSLAEKSVEAFDSGELTTDTDIKFVNEYTSLMDDLGSYVTPEQREAAKVTFKEKLADATVQSAAIGRDIAISALVTRNAGTLLGVGSKIGKLKNLMTTKWGKTGKHIFNISEEIVRGGVTFAPTDASFAEGAGEGLAQGSITAIMGKRGQALGRLAELGIRVTGGTATEVVQEYSGQLVNELTTAGVDVNEAFKRTFGRNIEDATDKLLLTATMSAMFSGAFNANVLFKTRETLQSELDEGNIPEEKIDDVEDVLKETAPKSEVSAVEEEIKPIEDVPTKEEVKEEKEITPVEDVKPTQPTQQSSDIEAKKADIEKRRQEELERKINDRFSRVEDQQNNLEANQEAPLKIGTLYNEGMKARATFVDKRTKPGDGYQVITAVRKPQINTDGVMTQSGDIEVTLYDSKEDAEKDIALERSKIEKRRIKKANEINAKYDAELAASTTTTQTSEVEADIEKRRQEAKDEAVKELPKDATPEEKRKYAIDIVLSGQVNERTTGKNIGILAREDFKMPNKEINKAISDIKKGNLETAPAKRLIDRLTDAYDAGGIPVIEGTGGTTVRRRAIPIEYFKEGVDEYNKKREYTDSELKEINDIQDELVEDHDSHFESLTEEEQIEKLEHYERINKGEVSEDTKGTESKSDVVGKTERSPKEQAKAKADLISEANNLKEGEDTRKIMKKAKAAGLSKDAELLEIVSPKAKAYRQHQEKLQKATRDALGIKEDFDSDHIFLNEDITDKIEEWKGEKLPSGTLKKSILEVNKTGDVSKGLDIMKNTDWYKDQSKEKQYEFEYDYKKSLGEDMTGVEKPSTKAVRSEIKSIKKEIRDRVNSKKYKGKSNKQLDKELNALNKIKEEDLTPSQKTKLNSLNTELGRRLMDKSLVNKKTDKELQNDLEKAEQSYEDGKTVFVRKTERSIIKDKIKSLQQGIKEGRRVEAKDLKELRNSLNSYIKETLKDFNLAKGSRNKMTTMIKNVNRKNYDSLIDKVDSEFKKLESEDKTRTISDIHELLTSPKTILGKKGKRKVGKVPIEIQQYLKAFDTSNLNEMTRDEVKQIYADLKAVVNEGKKKTKAIERAINAQKRRIRGDNFVALHKGNDKDGEFSYTVSGKESVMEELSKRDRVAIINGQLISSKTKFDESEKEVLERSEEISSLDDFNNFLEDNPDFNFDNVKIYITHESNIAAEYHRETEVIKISKLINPIYSTANLLVNLQPISKGSKTLRVAVEKLADKILRSENVLNKESNKKKNEIITGLESIFKKYNPKVKYGAKVRAKIRLSNKADIKVNTGRSSRNEFSNSHLIDMFLMAKHPEGKEKLEAQGFDIDTINGYMEDNKDLKEFSEFLLEWYNTTARDSYSETYEMVTNTKFHDGVYYPMYTAKTFDAMKDSGGIMDDNLNVSPMKAFAGSMISRVKNKAKLDVYVGSLEKAMHYIETMERVKQFSEVAEDVENIFTRSANSEIIEKIGVKKFDTMMEHLSISITGKDPIKKTIASPFISGIMAVKIFGALGWKTASVPAQWMSMFHFATSKEVTKKEWLAAFVPKNKKEWEVVKAFTTGDYVKDRFKGENLDREYNRLLKGGSLGAEFLKGTVKFSMLFIRLGDISAVIHGGSMLSIAIYRKGIDAGLSHDQAMDEAISKAEDESETAQQSALNSQTSRLQRSEVGRLFTAFKTSQIAAKNKMIYSMKVLLSDSGLTPEEKNKHRFNALYYMGASLGFATAKRGFQTAMFSSLFNMIFMGGGSEEDKKNVLKGVYDVGMDNVGSVLDGFGLEGYMVNMALNKLKGDDWKNKLPVMQEMEDLAYGSIPTSQWLVGLFTKYGSDWDDLSDAEKAEIKKFFAYQGIDKQINNWVAAYKGDKTVFEAIMNQPTKEKKEKYKKNQNDWLWNQMEGDTKKKKKKIKIPKRVTK